MTISVLLVHKTVIIDKILITGVVRRIDVDDVNPALVRIGKGSQGFEIVTFDKDMAGRIGILTDDSLAGVFNQHRQFFAKPFLHLFGLVFPDQTIFLLLAEQLYQCRFLVVCQTIYSAYLICQFILIHKQIRVSVTLQVLPFVPHLPEKNSATLLHRLPVHWLSEAKSPIPAAKC